MLICEYEVIALAPDQYSVKIWVENVNKQEARIILLYIVGL